MLSKLLAAFTLSTVVCSGVSAITLAKDGKTDFAIVISSAATTPETTAAQELQKYLKQVTSTDFPITRESEVKAGSPKIHVGQSPQVKRLLPEVNWDGLGKDGIVIKTVGNTLVLSGGRPRGTLYAVYTFLEDHVGIRWWTSTESFIPKKPTLKIPELDVNYTPGFSYREVYYRDVLENPLFAATCRLNGNHHAITKEYGSHYSIIGWCHTFYSLLPPDKYKDHPEWFSGNQLCMTNEAMQKELAKAALEWIRREPNAGIISISQNDGYSRCECVNCKKVEEEEGSPAGPLIRCINAVAAEVEKEYPDFLVETLAYVYSRKPPLHVKPRKNVLIRLCSIEGWFNKPLYHDTNKEFRNDMQGWSAISPNLFVWDYVTNFSSYILPHPNMHNLGENLRFFRKNKVVGVFEQGDSCTTVGDFVRLRAWLLSHLLWNPYQDDKKLRDEFIRGYYGAAAPYLSRYLDVISEAVERIPEERIGCGNLRTNYLTFNDVKLATELFAKAEKAVAGDPVIARRVRRERLPLDHVWLQRYYEFKEQAGKDNLPFPGPKDPLAACDEFIKMVNELDGRNYSEIQSFESYIPSLRVKFMPIPKAEDLMKVSNNEVDIQEDKLTLQEPGKLTKIVDDPAASNGKAAWMPADRWDCFINYSFTKDFAESHPGKWHIYLVARADISMEDSNLAFRFGLGDSSRNLSLTLGHTNHDCIDGIYKTCYIGSFELTPTTSIWTQPWPSGNVKGIYIDHIVLVPDRGDGKYR